MFPSKYLIVNADDFNLTRGTDRAILECHDKGIVSSTTVLVTLPISSSTAKSLKSRPSFGKGIHLSLTLGEAVSPKTPFQLKRDLLKQIGKIPTKVAEREYEAQILKFKRLIGQLPSHMDTHHHIHIYPNIMSAVKQLSRKYKIPFRRINSPLERGRHVRHTALDGSVLRRKVRGVSLPIGFNTPRRLRRHPSLEGTTHFLFEDLDPQEHWTGEKFTRCLNKLPNGISEIMVHPGYVDRDLKSISSFQKGREVERQILTSSKVKTLLEKKNIKLINFNDLRYFAPLYDSLSFPRRRESSVLKTLDPGSSPG